MARQVGKVKIVGKIKGISFYHSKSDGYLARKPGGFKGDRIRNEPRYQQVRNNYTEFATASRAAKMIKDALHDVTFNVADRRFLSRLTGALVKIVRMDAVNGKGSRSVQPENLNELKGFEFNKKKPLDSISGLHYQLRHSEIGIAVEMKLSRRNKSLQDCRRFVIGIAAIDFSGCDIKANVIYSEPGSLNYSEFLKLPSYPAREAECARIIVMGLQYKVGPEASGKWCTEVMRVVEVV